MGTEQVSTLTDLAAVILCGGKSSRLGLDKTQLIFEGRTFLENVVHIVGKVTDRIVLVGDIDRTVHNLPDSVEWAIDEDPDAGPLEGIRVGLNRVEDRKYAFVTSCDVPLLKHELIHFLYRHLGDANGIVPVDGQRIYGMTAIYRTDIVEEIANRIAQGKLRVSEISQAVNAIEIAVDRIREIDPNLDSMTNVNSKAEYQALLKRFDQELPQEFLKKLG